MDFDVTIDRDKYIGGSDIPVIMGISPFKTRYELLCEKAGLGQAEGGFWGDKYKEYGHIMEPKIRAYINSKMPFGKDFEPNMIIVGEDIRCHTDGFNGECVLEIKTTSHIYQTVDEYKLYLVQLVWYMEKNGVEFGKLSVYERDEFLNADFDPDKLQIFDICKKDYKGLIDEIKTEIDRFRTDLQRMKENPLLCEEDFQPDDLVVLSNKAVELESRMAEYKTLEKQYNDMKKELYAAMVDHNVKSWQMPNGTRITRVDGKPETIETVSKFDVEAFEVENPELFEKYLKQVEKVKSGRNGYVLITIKR